MKRKRYSEEKIISILKEADGDDSVKEVFRRHGIAPATYYQWKARYGGLQPSDLKRMKELERENAKLKQLYAETALENKALKDLIDQKL